MAFPRANISNLVERFTTGTYTRRRTPKRVYGTDGRISAGAPSTVDIVAHVQPYDNPQKDDQVRTPEGEYSLDTILVFSKDLLDVASATHEPDEILVDGTWYVVTNQTSFGPTGDYNRAFCQKKQLRSGGGPAQ